MDGDQLGQWRAYGKDSGYCIGFDSSELERLAVGQGYDLRHCEYNPRVQSAIVETMVENRFGSATNAEAMQRGSLEFLREFLAVAPTFKDRSFGAEVVYRLSTLQLAPMNGYVDPSIKYRPGKSFYVPYKEFNLTDKQSTLLPIRLIYLGPTPHRELSAWTVRNHLQALGLKFDTVKVYPSKVPYRAW
jgi:hypothetical protein